jgi:hypothetical protein
MGEELGWQDPLEPYKPALGSVAVSLVPGLNSYTVLTDPEASTAGKVFAVGGDALAVVGVGAAIKFGKFSIKLGSGLLRAAPMLEGADVVIEGTDALMIRARQVHGVLDQIAQAQRTTAVLDTSAGRIVAGGGPDLTRAQRAALLEGEIAGKLKDAHAEATALEAAAKRGLKPQSLAATRIICPQCAAAIEASGGTLTSPTTAVWP